MVLNTKHFGELQIEEAKLIQFKDGIPGFPKLNRFILLSEPDGEEGGFFYWLQSAEDPEKAFVLVDMIKYNPDYNPQVEQAYVEDLGSVDPDDFLVYNIAVMPEDPKKMTVNLRAPIVINPNSMLGKQVVCVNEDYEVKHYLFAEAQ